MAPASLPAVLSMALLSLSGVAVADPWLYIDKRKATSCTSHPTRGYEHHGAPREDSSASFVVLDSDGKVTKTMCAGKAYTLSVTFPSLNSEALITSSNGVLDNPWEDSCPGRAAIKTARNQKTYNDTLTLDCKAANNVTIGLTWASDEFDTYKQVFATNTVDPACAAAACPQNTVASSPPPKASSPPPKAKSPPTKAKKKPPPPPKKAGKKSPPPPKKA